MKVASGALALQAPNCDCVMWVSFIIRQSSLVICNSPVIRVIRDIRGSPLLPRVKSTEIQYNKRAVREHRCCMDLTRNFETPAHALVKRLPGPDRERPKVV